MLTISVKLELDEEELDDEDDPPRLPELVPDEDEPPAPGLTAARKRVRTGTMPLPDPDELEPL